VTVVTATAQSTFDYRASSPQTWYKTEEFGSEGLQYMTFDIIHLALLIFIYIDFCKITGMWNDLVICRGGGEKQVVACGEIC
jgi:hypothetical protein